MSASLIEECLRSAANKGCASVEAPQPASSHLLFVPTPARYLLLERDGAPPDSGSELDLSEAAGSFVVSKVGAAPFPGEARPCAFLLPRG